MALPLPRTVADVGPGGGLVTAMGGMNSLANDMILRKMNQIKSQYLPQTMQAEAASKLAYANLMAPQFLAKAMTNPDFMGNLTEEQRNQLKNIVHSAGTFNSPANNAMNDMPQNTGVGHPSTNNISGWVQNAMKNAFNQNGNQQHPVTMPNAMNQMDMKRPPGAVMREGEQWYNAKGEPVYEEEAQETGPNPMKLELTQGITPKTYPEKAGEYRGTIKQLEKEGEYRADALKAIGDSQLALSNSGAVLDRMTGLITNPVFANMRNKIPGFQNKQLDYLKVMGTPEEKELIGDFLSTGESFIASTVQGFGGKPLVREFDLAQRQKITGHDTVESAIGKMRSARSLHDIAEKKNQIVSELLQKGYNEADAVKQANKMVDVSAIEKATNERLQRKITVRNDKTGATKTVTIEEARKMGIPNV